MEIQNVDICCGLGTIDEEKGKLITELFKKKKYDFVCRWSGGSSGENTININGLKYHTHIIPSGVFYGIKSIIGPDCYVNCKDFLQEIKFLKKKGFDTSLVKIFPNTHIITNNDIKNKYNKGISSCAKDKFYLNGILSKDIPELKDYIFDKELYGDILCEGAQGFWLDINQGNYPYVTSSYTLPYSACSLGFPPQKIRSIYGLVNFFDNIYNVNWLNLDKLVSSINISGTTNIIISNINELSKIGVYKYIWGEKNIECLSIVDLMNCIKNLIIDNCFLVKQIIFSDNPETIKEI
uniref:Adenylosuccinate synthase n=1 Tax=viral metagenome TaxID=1070528 RepID=A0A6C0JBN0_9ZZZZ